MVMYNVTKAGQVAYKTEDLEKQALEAIKEHNIMFINDLVAYMPCDKTTLYAHKIHESNNIKALLEQNRIVAKNGLRDKWYKSDNATLQVALMKLIADDDERKKLSQQYTDLTTGGDKIEASISARQAEQLIRARAERSDS